MRLLYVSSDTYPPKRVDVSVLFGKYLRRLGLEPVWVLQEEAHGSGARGPTGQGEGFIAPADRGRGHLARVHRHWQRVRNVSTTLRWLGRDTVDGLQAKDVFGTGWMTLRAARRLDKPFFYWLSFPFPENWLQQASEGAARYPAVYRVRGVFSKWLLYRRLMPGAAVVFVQSDQMKRDIEEEGIPGEKLIPVPMGVDWDDVENVMSAAETPRLGEGRHVVYLGTLSRTRHPDFLVRVHARVIETCPDTTLHLIGAGTGRGEEEELAALARQLGIGARVRLHGMMPREEAWRFTAAADVCLSPFFPKKILLSTSPTKLVEYLALGRPAVANDHPDQKVVIERSGGGLCVPYDEEAFAKATCELLDHPDMAEEMGRRGRAWVRRERTYEVLAARVFEVYRRQLAEGRNGRHER